jgi:hypothetical protein
MRDNKEMEKLKLFNPMALREKYSAKNLNKKNNFSSFWMEDDWNTNRSSIFDDEEVKPKVDLIALASYRRAIGNFVNIVTGKNIKVTFTTSGDSYTDGKKVTISSKLDDKLFDSTVGLALHEGSHILLSDFDFLKQLEVNIPKEYTDRAFVKGYGEMDSKVHIKNLLNFVEDRRIDYHIFSNSPGYKGYYHSMYDKYFRSKVVDRALLSDEMTDENWDSYFFRIINLTNSNTQLDSLNGLMEIWKTIDLKNISRLQSSDDSFYVALDIYDIILNNIPDGNKKTDEDGNTSYEREDGSGSTDSNSEGGGKGSGKEESRELTDEEFNELMDAVESGDVEFGSGSGSGIELDDMGGESSIESSESGKGGESKSSENTSDKKGKKKKSEIVLTESQKKSLEKAITKQKKFMDGDIAKKKVSKKDKAAMDSIDESGMSYKEVGKDLTDEWSGEKLGKTTKCIVVKNLTKSLVDSGTVNMISANGWYRDETEESINEGLRLGTILGRKLQIRTESRDTKYTRKDTGRIDKRLIAELGFGNSNVFSQTFIESFPDATLHISVDASGSMSGSKWYRTIKSVTAMVKAIDMIEGVDAVVSFRSTQHNNDRNGEDYPIILIAYDSRKDTLVKVKTLWKYIRVNGTTPEGLCYEAIMNEMESGGTNKESYFLNFSDGMPMFSNGEVYYHSDTAINHTKLMMKKFREKRIKVLSYFIGDSYGGERNMKDFKTMYGKDAEFVDVTSVTSVSRSMNKRFLTKD